ncbi:hypothetical protein KQX54_017615 [Cotesia glomerata]|uniref:Uncharacterized protein n=1 Tax=Cotesia glomerata TaxID=32391 RepID=A0AAV7IZK2_COTGL|nr:hypothetical protein KQX54_017615 [Cotesia glomerata]
MVHSRSSNTRELYIDLRDSEYTLQRFSSVRTHVYLVFFSSMRHPPTRYHAGWQPLARQLLYSGSPAPTKDD